MYSKLSSTQKLNLWKSKLKQAAAQPITERQKEAILDINSKLSEELFQQEVTDIFNNELLMRWLYQYGDYFTELEGKLIFEVLSDFNPASIEGVESTQTYKDLLMADKEHQNTTSSLDDNPGGGGASLIECSCRHGAYCSSIGDCTTKIRCKRSTVGCGHLWLQACIGLCGEETGPNPSQG